MEVAYSGIRGAKGVMTWGQLYMVEMLKFHQPVDHFHLRRALPIPAGVSVSQIAATLRDLVERHETLRTRFSGSDREQYISRVGSVSLHIVDFAPDEEGQVTSFIRELAENPFDLANELPVRFGLVTVAAEPRYFIMVASHVAIDGWSLAQLCSEFSAALNGATYGPSSDQPLERSHQEGSPTGRRRADAAVGYWSEQIGEPLRILQNPPPHTALTPRFHHGILESSRVLTNVEQASHRHSVSTSTIFLAAVVDLLGRRYDTERVTLLLNSANRTSLGARGCVTSMSQSIPCTIVRPESDIPELLRRTRTASLRAYRHAWFNYDEVSGLIVRASNDGLAMHFNDIWSSRRTRATAPSIASRFRWLDEVPRYGYMFDVGVLHAKAGIGTGLHADTTHFTRSEIYDFVVALEQWVVRAATTPPARS